MPHDNGRPPVRAEPDLSAVATFLRRLAERVEQDPAFGSQVAQLLAQSGIGHSISGPARGDAPRGRRAPSLTPAASPASGASAGATVALDPFVLLREAGADGARVRLAELDVPALRQVVRIHRLDPARISARWTNRERLIDLIITQVRARADHGKSFAHI